MRMAFSTRMIIQKNQDEAYVTKHTTGWLLI